MGSMKRSRRNGANHIVRVNFTLFQFLLYQIFIYFLCMLILFQTTPFSEKIKNKLYPNRHANMFFTDICSETEKWYDLFICGLIN